MPVRHLGFEMATQNDVPMAEKCDVVASAFLGVDMKCRDAHDAPYHPWENNAICFSWGPRLAQSAIKVPETSSVPAEFFDRKGDDALVEVTLRPGRESVPAKWPSSLLSSEEFGPITVSEQLLQDSDNLRERLAAMITRGENRRFAQVMVNRLWTELTGWGLIDSADDWYEASTRYPDLLE